MLIRHDTARSDIQREVAQGAALSRRPSDHGEHLRVEVLHDLGRCGIGLITDVLRAGIVLAVRVETLVLKGRPLSRPPRSIARPRLSVLGLEALGDFDALQDLAYPIHALLERGIVA